MEYNEFIDKKEINNLCNHRHLLWIALERTSGLVVEMGMGHGSTPYLSQYCKDAGRQLYSYDTDTNWLEKFKQYASKSHIIIKVTDWDSIHVRHPEVSVVLVDHAPGERRKIDIELWKDRCLYLVAHDTEPAAEHGYQMRPVLEKYNFLKDYKTIGAWSTIVSNTGKL